MKQSPKVTMFRTMYDPMIGPTPKQAFVPESCGLEAHLTEIGVNVKVLSTGHTYLVPFSNIQSIRYEEVVIEETYQPTQPVKIDKRTKEYKERADTLG